MKEPKKKILVFIDWYLPAYKAGGPVRSVANMIHRLKHEFEFRIVTSDRDLHDSQPYPGIALNKWINAPDGTTVRYLDHKNQSYSNIRKIMYEERADFIYLNSLYSKNFSLIPLLVRKRYFPHRKVILACRGMLGSGAMKNKKGKKRLFITAARILGLFNNIRWQSTSEQESRDIAANFGRQSIVNLVPNLTEPMPESYALPDKQAGTLRMAYVARIAPMKNIELILKILSDLPPEDKVIFDIYGAIDDKSYWDKCSKYITVLPPHVEVTYRGTLPHDRVKELWSDYHVSVLLTFNENFGHSILESLAAGVPVIISRYTPWHGLTPAKAGYDLPLEDESAITEAVRHFVSMGNDEIQEWSRGARQYAANIIDDTAQIEKYRKLFS